MSKRLSSGAVDFISSEGSIAQALQNGRLYFFSGTQPSSADTASGSTAPLVEFTEASATYTAETRATFTIFLGTTGTGNLTALTVGGVNILPADSAGAPVAIALTGSAAATGVLICDAINSYRDMASDFKATVNGSGLVTVTAPKNSGVQFNGVTVAYSKSGTADLQINGGTSVLVGGGGATAGVAAANGLKFTFPNASAGVLVKGSAAWTGVAAVSGTVGWFRFCGDGTSHNTTSTTAIRFDGIVGTSSADLIVSSTSITSGATQTINTFTINTLQLQS